MNTALKSGVPAANSEVMFDMRSATEAQIIRHLSSRLDAELDQFPEFAALLEDTDEFVCTRSELLEALRSAPTVNIQIHLFSIYQFREHISMITGRSFV